MMCYIMKPIAHAGRFIFILVAAVGFVLYFVLVGVKFIIEEVHMHAFTKYPNTPETDLQAEVPHIVIDDYGTEHEFLAACPVVAIAMFHEQKRAGEQVSKHVFIDDNGFCSLV